MFFRDLLGIGWYDLEFIEKYYRLVKNEIDFSELEYLPLRDINANVILYEIFYRINNEIFNGIKNRDGLPKAKEEEITNICNTRIDEFSPFINCIDSWFNNEIDDVSTEGKRIGEIADEVYFLLLHTTDKSGAKPVTLTNTFKNEANNEHTQTI